MAQSPARDAEAFARLMLHTVERLGHDGGWVRARDALDRTVADHPDHAFVAQLKARPARRIGLFAAVERLRGAEFAHLERRKAGTRRGAPVAYRISRPVAGLDLQLPYDVPASHPLLLRRRADAAAQSRPTSARRAAMTRSSPNSPWRRRLLRRATAAGAAVAPASWSVRRWWVRLRAAVSALASGITGR
jgi:hypothetical protein